MKRALLIVDVQRGFEHPSWGERNNPFMEQHALALLQHWRQRSWPIIHAKHNSVHAESTLRPGQPGNDFKPEFSPAVNETVIEKRVHSVFIGTPLERYLRECEIPGLVIVGLTTNHCVSTSARMAHNLGFTCWVVGDATATFDRVGPGGKRFAAQLVHEVALSDLHGEFSTVVDTNSVLHW